MSTAQSPELAIGLMSGTSTDGVDGVLLSMADNVAPGIKATCSATYPAAVARAINDIISEPRATLAELGHLHVQLGELYAQAALQLTAAAGNSGVAVIGCHGQTIHHAPDSEHPFSMQIGSGAVVAARTGIAVITDFRSADMAAGGQGAPLAPAFHQAVFASNEESRAIVNLGGIANITHLPAPDSGVIGFDTGPANTLLDRWCRSRLDLPFDRDGGMAASGTVNPVLLETMLQDPYFSRPSPKSTGREYFNLSWLQRILGENDAFSRLADADMLATLAALSAHSVADQVNALVPRVDRVLACGGGVHNRVLMDMIGNCCDAPLDTTAHCGIDPQWVEASAFAWIAWQSIHGRTSTLPQVTGADRATIAGALHLPPPT